MNKPRVTLEGEIISELEVESSTLGALIDIAGQSLPTFGTRRVTSMIRMREGESLMVAGLLREDQRRALTGFPGLLRTPILRRIFGNTVDQINQTDIVFLMTPRLVRSSEVTQENLDPIYIGSQQNLGLTGAPPLIASDPAAATPPAGGSGAAATPQATPTAQPLSTLPGQPQTGPVTTGPAVLPAGPLPPAAATGQQAIPVASAPPAPAPPPPAPPAAAAAPPCAHHHCRCAAGVHDQRVGDLQPVRAARAVGPAGDVPGPGGVTPTFTQQIDPGAGRADLTALRPGDQVGATGTGLVATLVFEAIAPGQSAITPAGVASNPEQGSVGLQLVPAAVTVR